MSIPEAAHLVIQAACMTKGHDLYILEMGEEVKSVELAERMIRLRGLRPYKDIPIEFIGMRPGETLHEGLVTEDEVRCTTPHPHIFGVQFSQFNTVEFLEHTAHLLNGNLKSKPEDLKKMVLDLALSTRSKRH
jgi:FlaA1/EpsC-like NDP-sugar epimerase